MEAAKDAFLTNLGLVEYWKEHTGVRYAKFNTVYSRTNVATKTIYGVFINENKADEMLTFIALFNNNYEVMAKDVKENATQQEVSAHIARYAGETDVY